MFKDVVCRFVSVRAGRVFEVLRFVPVRVKIRLRVTRFVSCVSEICLRVMRVGIRAPHCVFVCLCVSCVSRVMRVACHACQNYCVSCVSRVMRVWIGCGSVRVRVRFLRVCGSCLFLRVLELFLGVGDPNGVLGSRRESLPTAVRGRCSAADGRCLRGGLGGFEVHTVDGEKSCTLRSL